MNTIKPFAHNNEQNYTMIHEYVFDLMRDIDHDTFKIVLTAIRHSGQDMHVAQFATYAGLDNNTAYEALIDALELGYIMRYAAKFKHVLIDDYVDDYLYTLNTDFAVLRAKEK